MPRRTPTGPPPPPVVQRLRVHYAKRGRLRFSSHRDFARAFERALRRAEIPMGYSAGFSPHPKISYVGAAPTGVASEAEYLEIGLARECDPDQVRAALDAALPEGLDIVAVVPAGAGSLPERIQASHWHVELPGVDPDALHQAVLALLGSPELQVERVTKDGRRTDRRAPGAGERQGASHRRRGRTCDTGPGSPAGFTCRSTRRHPRRVADRRRSRPRRTGCFGARGAGAARRDRDGQRPAGPRPPVGGGGAAARQLIRPGELKPSARRCR